MNPDDKADKPAPKKPPEKQPAGRVFDVSRPGKSPATPTSKPVIVGHKPEAQQAQTSVSGIGEAKPIIARRKIQIMPSGDLQVADEDKPSGAASAPETPQEVKPEETPQQEQEAIGAAAVDAAAGPPAVPGEEHKLPTKHLTIEPPANTETKAEGSEPQAETPAEAPKPDEQPKAESEAVEPNVEKTEEEAPKTLADELPKDSSSVPTETSVENTDKPEGEESAPAEPEVKIDPLFDESGRMVVSQHNHHRHHGAKVTLLLLLILLLAVAALDILLDLQILNLEGIPHTDFL